jgi:hypothetical protein
VSDHQLPLPPSDHTSAPSGPAADPAGSSVVLAGELERLTALQEQTLGVLTEVQTEQLAQRLLLLRLLDHVQGGGGSGGGGGGGEGGGGEGGGAAGVCLQSDALDVIGEGEEAREI